MGRPATAVDRSFWKNRRVFVTGVTGFVGSWLAERLVQQDAQVVGLVKEIPPDSNFSRLGLRKRITVVRGSLENGPLLERAVRKHATEIVYHLGAQALVGKANLSPRSTFTANIEGTWNLLEACRKAKRICAVIVASSDKAYGSHKRLPYREDFPLLPQYPYDVSKACAELIARSYYFTFNLPVLITRCANIYGPGDTNYSRIVPDTVRRVLNGNPPVLRSDGTPERDYIYIDDVINLYLLLAEKGEKNQGGIFNAGHNRPVSILRLVNTILRLAGRTDLKPRILAKGKLRGEIDRQWLDSGKARRFLNWSPKTPLEQGLRKTLNWHRVNSSLPGGFKTKQSDASVGRSCETPVN